MPDDSPMRKHARAYDEVVRQAEKFVDGGDGADATALRAAVEAERKAFSDWRADNKKRLATERTR